MSKITGLSTLGTVSTHGGQKLKGVRRHPTIGDNVTIYAGASVLGGESVIGSNVFITSSIPEGISVSVKSQELRFKQHGAGSNLCSSSRQWNTYQSERTVEPNS